LVFKDIKGNRIDPLSHTTSLLKIHPELKIYIGSDSQNLGKKTIYCTVIAYRFGNKGVHYIFNKKSHLLITDIWNRLWHEAELSLDTAVWLNQKLKVKIEIDMDYNNDETHKSFKLISAAKGWANSLGYKVNIKPQIQVATRAADYNCK
jgi:predicted RNase H-related nuclease YkuK (DUF458 family)|tara:strand:+ start:479 stop:925 length:447 start_codon:yes stop_codon:yes gene_type:complete